MAFDFDEMLQTVKDKQWSLADIDEATAKETVERIAANGGAAYAVGCDVSIEDDVVGLEQTARGWLGQAADLVVNNAGIGAGGSTIGRTPLDEWRRTLGVNLWGVIHGCHVFVPPMRDLGSGGVINVASAAGFTAAPRMAAYNVSKAGVVSLSETLAAELAGSGVAVTVLCPTFVKTNIFDGELIAADASNLARRVGSVIGFSPERVARMALDGHDRGRLYVLPQPDAQLLWRAKRLVPGPYARFAGVIDRLAPTFDGE